jgi:hypothetical protein
MRRSLAILGAGVVSAFAACDGGPGVAATFSHGDGGSPGSGGSGAGDSSASSTTTTSTTTTSTSTTSSSSSSSTTGAGGGGTGGGETGGGGSGGSEPACDYGAPNTCIAPTEIEPINGDTGSDVRVLNGTTSKWFKLRINEGSNFINDMSYVVTLQSPPGMDFDLYEYVGDGMATNCLGDAIHAMGDPESVSDAWGDSIGTDNGRWISLEVRYISGSACGPGAKWTLTAEGHK